MITVTLQEIIEDMDTAFLVKTGRYTPRTIICDEDESLMSGVHGYEGVHKLYAVVNPIEDIVKKTWLEVNPFNGNSMGRRFSARTFCAGKDASVSVIFTVIPRGYSPEYSPSVELQQKQMDAFLILQNGKLSVSEKAMALYKMMCSFWTSIYLEEKGGQYSENEWAAFYDLLEDYVIELDPELWRKRSEQEDSMELPTLRNY